MKNIENPSNEGLDREATCELLLKNVNISMHLIYFRENAAFVLSKSIYKHFISFMVVF